MHNSKIKRISLAVCLALMPFAADAAGLGKMTVMSGLGEPLAAEIDISGSKDELSALTARIATADTYAEQGIDRTAALGGIRVELANKADGSPVLKLSTKQPVNDPFLDMLIQVDWPTGRLLREYTALLDPPGYGERASAAAGEQLPSAATPSKKNTSKRVSPPGTPGSPLAAPQEKPSNTDTYVTKRGDTLRNVARNTQVDDVTLEQMLVGLFHANRSAFMDDNMNQLKVGQIIRVPSKAELQSVSPDEALKEVRVQTANWNAYRNKMADTVAKSGPDAQKEEQQQAASGKITAAAEDKNAPPAPAGPHDVVKLSKSEVEPGKGAAAAKSGADTDKLKALEEESTSQDKAIAEVNERIAFFEKQIQDMQKLLLVQNQILADLQKGKPAQAAEGAMPPPAPAEMQPSAPASQMEPPKPKPPAPTPKPAKKMAPPPPPEPSLLDSMMEDPMLIGGAGGALVLLAGGWFYLRNKRRKSLDAFEKGILTSGGLKSDTAFANTGNGAADTGETSFLSDFGHRGDGMIDTSDVDPISEAEVYMAYGRDAQAEEILKDAISKEPKRYELHHKLLEIYSNRKDVAAFETLAGELYTTLGANDPNWLAVAEMGRALEPENPMYASGSEAAAATVASDAVDAEPMRMPAPDAAEQEAEAPAAQDNSLDFDLGMLAEEPADEASGIEKESGGEPSDAPRTFDSSFEAVAEEAPADDVVPEESAAEDTSVMDFQFELPEPAAEEVVQLGAAELGLPEEEPEAEASFELPSTGTLEAPGSATAAEPVQEGADLGLPELSVAEAQADTVEEISFDLPEIDVSEEASAEAAPAGGASMELPELPSETPEPPVEQALAEETMDMEPPAVELDLPELELPQTAEPATEQEVEIPAAEAAAEFALPDMELPTMAEDKLAEVAQVEEVSQEPEAVVPATPAVEENVLDFDFDADIGGAAEAEPTVEEAPAVPDLDLSGISLDIGNPSAPDVAETTEEITLSGGEESADVDTKLDLVTAYMDMGDTEGARELLEEVMQEGGPQQRERAQKLLDSL